MCRPPASSCSVLGLDPSDWSKESLLVRPAWFDKQLDLFVAAVRCAANGDRRRSEKLLATVRSEELKNWYRDHALNSGRIRSAHFRSSVGTKPTLISVRGKPSASIVSETFKRDGYRCRYCGLRVIPKKVLQAFQQVVGKDSFPMPKPDGGRHGAALVFIASPEHVGPRCAGGSHNVENLITACWSCQFGKWYFTLEHLGLDDPRLRPPMPSDDWDGLVRLLPALRRSAKLARP